MNAEIFEKASTYLRKVCGPDAEFRDGQYEAIEATMLNKRTLVVQKTGWGKSLVYFISAKLLWEEKRCPTLIISPLLVLMDNQAAAAKDLGLTCEILNSSVKGEDRAKAINRIRNNETALVFTTPETLSADDVQELLERQGSIGLFVIDEAHCISEWGHDFRLKYGQLYKVIEKIPSNIPVLATTATATDRVIADLEKQLGGNVSVHRGPLMRESLSIQILKLPSAAERYGWILENINKFDGSGIIYCLTQRDCENIADFLNCNGISARPYHSDLEQEDTDDAERKFMNNEIKVIAATTKLGMGYDKGDIAFVIHYQQPSGIISYYQQIGRAGRKLDIAYTFLMCGGEDDDIHNYFIQTAFPTREDSESVYDCIRRNSQRGMSINDILKEINIKYRNCDKALRFMLAEELIYKIGSKYHPAKDFFYNQERYNKVSEERYADLKQLKDLTAADTCLNRFVVNALDDPTTESCGKCSVCLGYNKFPDHASDEYINKALDYFENHIPLIKIQPKKQWPNSDFTGRRNIDLLPEEGICLSKYGAPGYGERVSEGKYRSPNGFCDKLVEKSAGVLASLIAENNIRVITCVPSNRTSLVADFTAKLAEKCGVEFRALINKADAPEAVQQKNNNNSYFRCRNAWDTFIIAEGTGVPQENILLVDDIVDSGWTLTVCEYKLMAAGCGKVFPYALASSADNSTENQ